MLAATPAPVHNDIGDADDDDESLNEDDDDDDLDDVGQGEDVNSEHLVLAKFDKVLFFVPAGCFHGFPLSALFFPPCFYSVMLLLPGQLLVLGD